MLVELPPWSVLPLDTVWVALLFGFILGWVLALLVWGVQRWLRLPVGVGLRPGKPLSPLADCHATPGQTDLFLARRHGSQGWPQPTCLVDTRAASATRADAAPRSLLITNRFRSLGNSVMNYKEQHRTREIVDLGPVRR